MPYSNGYQTNWLADSLWAAWMAWGFWGLGWLFSLIGAVTTNECYYVWDYCTYDMFYGYIGLTVTGAILWIVGLTLILVRRHLRKRVLYGSTRQPNSYKQVPDTTQPYQPWQRGVSSTMGQYDPPHDPYSSRQEVSPSPPRPLPNLPQRVPVPQFQPVPFPSGDRGYSSQWTPPTQAAAELTLATASEDAIRRQHIEEFMASKEFQDQINKAVTFSMGQRSH